VELVLLAAVVLLAGGFAFLNGFHDVSNSVAAPVRTGALTPTVAVILAAAANLAGALLGTGLALYFVVEGIRIPAGTQGMGILAAGLVAACAWGIFTWYQGMPSSSTHALVGGVLGAGGAFALLSGTAMTGGEGALWRQVVLPLLVSPVAAFAVCYLLVFPAVWALRHNAPGRANSGSRMAQAVLAGAFALGHGLQDGQRTMVVVMLALMGAGMAADSAVPSWVQVFAAVLLAAGSLFGGWRITHTLAQRLVRMDPVRGMTAQGVSAAMLLVGALALHMPLSSTHVMTAGIMGAGVNQRFSSLSGSVLMRVLATWCATPLVTALLGAILYLALTPFL
jgi:PiT family inorganic phosphate transporter